MPTLRGRLPRSVRHYITRAAGNVARTAMVAQTISSDRPRSREGSAATEGSSLSQTSPKRGDRISGQVFGEGTQIRREMVNRHGLALSQFCAPSHRPTSAAEICAPNGARAR